jgi:glycosyltransferase involved in cell wall biosynthesis
LRIAAISHSCVIKVNQQIYVELRKRPDVELMLIAPQRWVSSLGGWVTFTALPGLDGISHPLPTTFPGQMHLHWYEGLRATLEAFAPDILYVDEEPYSLVTSQALRCRAAIGCKFVFYTKQSILKRYPPPASWLQAQVLRATHHALVINDDAEKVLRARGYAGDVTQFPHGIDADFLAPRDSADLRARLHIQGPIIGYVGRIAPEKGVYDLLAATRMLYERLGPAFTVVLIGDGPARWELAEAAAQDLPRGMVRFLGSVVHDAMPAYLNLLDLLVLPSRTQRNWKEQFGRVLVEALACGVPLVGSDSGHIPALITGTGGGLVYAEGNVEELADKIALTLKDPGAARAMALNGRKVVLDSYSYSRIADILYGTLRRVADA